MVSKIIDIHTHIGLYEDYYHLSLTHFEFLLNEFPIEKVFCAPTSWQESVDNIVSKTIETAPSSIKHKLYPILWLNPVREQSYQMLSLINQAIAIKLHPFADKYDFMPFLLNKFLGLIEEYQKPICIHTGNEGCNPLLIEKAIPESYKNPIILFHSRPINEAVLVAKKRSCIYLECSFVTPSDIEYALGELGEHKIMFGSDYPIQCAYYRGIDILNIYKKNLYELYNITEKVGISDNFFYNNAKAIFSV